MPSSKDEFARILAVREDYSEVLTGRHEHLEHVELSLHKSLPTISLMFTHNESALC